MREGEHEGDEPAMDAMDADEEPALDDAEGDVEAEERSVGRITVETNQNHSR